MPDNTLEIQNAIVAALVADAGFGAICEDRIYDRPPQDVDFPYAEFGPFNGEPYDGQAFDGWESFIEIHSWSRKWGRVECQQIMAAIEAVLHEEQLTLDSASFSLGRLVDQRTLEDPDGITTHGVQRFRFITGT